MHGIPWHMCVHAWCIVAHACAGMALPGTYVCMPCALYAHKHMCAPLCQCEGCCQLLLVPEPCHLLVTEFLITHHRFELTSFLSQQVPCSNACSHGGSPRPRSPCSGHQDTGRQCVASVMAPEHPPCHPGNPVGTEAGVTGGSHARPA